jgi:hypothetical protein
MGKADAMTISTARFRLSDHPERDPSAVDDQSIVLTISDAAPSARRHPGGRVKEDWFIMFRTFDREV